MTLRQTPDEYLFHLEALTPAESKRLWKERIKENWNHTCAYCGSTDDITLDHIKPRSLGGSDTSNNVICACHKCNQDKGHQQWKEWFKEQSFYTWERMRSIESWMEPIDVDNGRYNSYRRKNVCYSNVA